MTDDDLPPDFLDPPPDLKAQKLRNAGWPEARSFAERHPWATIALLTVWCIAAAVPAVIMLRKLL